MQISRLKWMIFIVASLLLSACDYKADTDVDYSISIDSQEPAPPSNTHTATIQIAPFEQVITKPGWYHNVRAASLNSIGELDALWRGKKRCCIDEDKLLANNREFYKGCYQGIVNNPGNEKLIVKCLWLMDAGADKEQRLTIKEYLINNYPNHKNDVSACAHCAPADTVARVTHEVARQAKYRGETEKAAKLIENLFDTRRTEISLWVQTEIYETLSRIYLSSSISPERKARLEDAYQRLNKVRQYDDTVERRFKRFENAYMQAMSR